MANQQEFHIGAHNHTGVEVESKLSHYHHVGAKGTRKYSFSFLTLALDGVVSVTPRPRFTPGKGPPVPTE
jgi:hypothetical protein